MIRAETVVKISDNSAIVKGKCIKVYGNKKYGSVGDVILMSIQQYYLNKGFMRNKKKKKRYSKGSLHRGLIIRTKFRFKRSNNIWVNFTDNAVILINKRGEPLASRIKGPVPWELVLKKSSLISLCTEIV